MPTTTTGATATRAADTGLRNTGRVRIPAAPKTVVIVNGGTVMLDLVQTALDAGHYDIVFVESNAHAYSQIKRVQPNLVILCLRIEDRNGLQVLSMLKLDEDTREIPVLTYTTEYDGPESEDQEPEPSGSGIFTTRLALRMN